MEELARIFIRDELKVPDARSLYRTRDRLEPWATLLPSTMLDALKKGAIPENLGGLEGHKVSIGLWPDENDVKAYATFFYKVLSNGIAELIIEGREPIDCEVFSLLPLQP